MYLCPISFNSVDDGKSSVIKEDGKDSSSATKDKAEFWELLGGKTKISKEIDPDDQDQIITKLSTKLFRLLSS